MLFLYWFPDTYDEASCVVLAPVMGIFYLPGILLPLKPLPLFTSPEKISKPFFDL